MKRGKLKAFYLYKNQSVFTIMAKNVSDAMDEARMECPKNKFKLERKGNDIFAIHK